MRGKFKAKCMNSTSLKVATILEGVVILKYSHLDRPELECFWSATGPVIDSMPQIGTVLERFADALLTSTSETVPVIPSPPGEGAAQRRMRDAKASGEMKPPHPAVPARPSPLEGEGK